MGLIQGENGKPLRTEEPAAKHNGTEHPNVGTADVRTIPTGTLIFNLIRSAGEEMGLEGAIHQIEAQKQAQKLVTDPPPLVRMREVHAMMSHRRYVMANELNQRFAAVDQARAAEAALTPAAPAEAPAGGD